MTPQTSNETPATQQPQAAQPAAPILSTSEIDTIVHDIFVVGLAAAAFFIKNPQTASRAGQVVGILQGLQLGTPAN